MILAGLALLTSFAFQEAEQPQPLLPTNSTDEVITPALTADPDQPHGVLRFSIRERNGILIPGRLTFVRSGAENPELFPGVNARPDNLAVRFNVVYCLSGQDAITVPAGEYQIYATRGIEWSQATESIEIRAGEELEWNPTLNHDVSSAGWISADFHLHTLTHSGHGDANMKERVISLIGEGVELAVATDHNHITDYHPTVEGLEAGEELSTIPGNEISTPIGHINAFPLDPKRAIIDPGITDAKQLFKLIREEAGEDGVEPVIQLNHPRWAGIDYFTTIGLDPVTGRTPTGEWAHDFDTIELLNENEGWGYHDADTAGDLPVGSGLHSVLQDWYNLLNLGYEYFVVGNSDSHTVHSAFAGYPRNFVASSTDQPDQIHPPEIADALRSGKSFISMGPFIDFKVDGKGPGTIIKLTEPRIAVTINIQAPSWIYLSRAKVIVNGDVHKTIPLEPTVTRDGKIRWPRAKAVVTINRDSWIHVIVEGDEGLEPVITGQRPILPLAISNPIWVQASNGSMLNSTWSWAITESALRHNLDGLRPNEAAMILNAGASQNVPTMPSLVRSGLSYGDRLVQLAALRAIESLAIGGLEPVLKGTLKRPGDAYLALAVCRALKSTGVAGNTERMADLFERHGSKTLTRYRRDLDLLLEGEPVLDWMVVGPFGDEDGQGLFQRSLGPELAFDPEASYPTKGSSSSWQAARAQDSGYLDLSGLNPEAASTSISFAQTWLHSPNPTKILYSMGSDDGCRLWIGGEEVYRDEGSHGASPMQQVGTTLLKAGWNRVVIGVQNGSGDSGLYFRVLTAGIENSPTRP